MSDDDKGAVDSSGAAPTALSGTATSGESTSAGAGAGAGAGGGAGASAGDHALAMGSVLQQLGDDVRDFCSVSTVPRVSGLTALQVHTNLHYNVNITQRLLLTRATTVLPQLCGAKQASHLYRPDSGLACHEVMARRCIPVQLGWGAHGAKRTVATHTWCFV